MLRRLRYLIHRTRYNLAKTIAPEPFMLKARKRSSMPHIVKRERNGTTARGAKNGRAKLSEVDVINIRLAASKRVTPDALASTYGVSIRTIQGILKRETWRHIT